MIGLNPSNSKLRNRAVRIVSRLKNISFDQAKKLLEEQEWNVAATLEPSDKK
jgi:N-acetylmuramic acid 6-phosphate (MurNAc-6-P) etherase